VSEAHIKDERKKIGLGRGITKGKGPVMVGSGNYAQGGCSPADPSGSALLQRKIVSSTNPRTTSLVGSLLLRLCGILRDEVTSSALRTGTFLARAGQLRGR